MILRPKMGAIGIQLSLAQSIEGGAAMEDEMVAILDLAKEEAMLASSVFALTLGKEGGESMQPLAPHSSGQGR